MKTDLAVALIQRYVPGFRIVNKSESRLHRAIDVIMRLFGNKGYMESLWTTIGYTAARPDLAKDTAWDEWQVILHEGWHGVQSKNKTRLGMGALYIFPQGIGVLSLLLTPVLALLIGPIFLWGLLGVIFLAPIPSPTRTQIELEAYKISAALDYWTWGRVSNTYPAWFVGMFSGPVYYWMCRNKKKIDTEFRDWHLFLESDTWGVVTHGEYKDYLRDCKKLAERLK